MIRVFNSAVPGEQWEEMLKYDKTLALGLNNCINIWESERDEYIV